MAPDQAEDMLPAELAGDAPGFLPIIDRDKLHRFLLHWLQSGDIIEYYEDNPADRDELMAAIQESTRPTPQIIPAQVPSKSDIPGDAASPTSQYSTGEYENSSGHAGQHATDDRNSPSISTQREGHLSDLRRRETSTGEDGVNNEETQANVAGGEDSEE